MTTGTHLGGAAIKARRSLVVLVVVLAGAAISAGAAQAATPKEAAWKVLGVTGPTNLPPKQSEIQRITIAADGGTFSLAQQTGDGTGTPVVSTGHLTYAVGSNEATIVDGTFEVGWRITATGLPTEVKVVSCSPDCASPGSILTLSKATNSAKTNQASKAFTKQMTGVTGTFHVGDEVDGLAIAPGTTVTEVGPGTLALSESTTFKYILGATPLTAMEAAVDIPFNATAADLQTALDALPAFAGALTVTGGPGGSAGQPYLLAYGGSLAEQNVPEFALNETALTGVDHFGRTFTVLPGGPGTGEIAIYPVNVGGLATSGTVSVELGPLPPGIVTAGSAAGFGWTCPGSVAGQSTATCTLTTSVPALGSPTAVKVPIQIGSPSAPMSSVNVVVSGGNARPASDTVPLVVSSQPAEPGIQAFWAGAFEANGEPATQAGGHPFGALADFELSTVRSGSGQVSPAADVKDVDVDLPPGFLGNPLVTKRCPQSKLAPESSAEGNPESCMDEMVVGGFYAHATNFSNVITGAKVYNDIPVFGSAAEFATKVIQPLQSIIGSIRSEGDFGVRIVAPSVATFETVYGSVTALEGEPAAAHGKAFLVNPTDCAQQREERAQGRGPATKIAVSSWQQPSVFSHSEDALPLLTGCRALTESWLGQGPEPKKPSFTFQPTTTQGSSGAGATAHLHISQEGLSDPEKLATADLKKAVVTLPHGLTLNPSSANGLQACSEEQIGYLGSGFASPSPIRFNNAAPTCPDASKLGTIEASSPLLEEPIGGTVYLAAQDKNPFHSLIALYLVIESPRFGLTVKLPGEVRPDPVTGQLTATFDNNPQLPVEDLTLHFRGGGPRSELATPEVCGRYTTSSSLTPWSAENGEAAQVTEAGFEVQDGCSGSAGARRFSPSFEAGIVDPLAGAYSPLVIKVNRNDGEQELTSLNFTLPPGLTGKLAGILYCSDAAIAAVGGRSGKDELASPSCPSASQLGTVDTAAGVGSEPIHVGGSVYLAGPYKGAPLSSVVITPAVAGPFDLGNVVVRAPLFVDPETAQITAKSDPIPTILKGIPLKVRSVTIKVDRSQFTLNPTSCEAMRVTASFGSSNGAMARPSNRFQVGGCNKLKFKPKLKLSLKGATRRIGHPALKAVLTYPKQGAYSNIARAQVNLPHSEFLDQGNLNKTCTKPVLLEGKCPKKSIYGKAKAWTPLLDKPLQGPVYLVGGYGYKLPALVAELNGQIRVVLKGKVDSGPNKGIRNTFEAVPDAPVSRFVLEMKGGKKYGLLENSENLCQKPQRAIARFTAQNGLVDHAKPLITNQCGKKKHRKHRKRARHANSSR